LELVWKRRMPPVATERVDALGSAFIEHRMTSLPHAP
jgi:hypothetical protein